MANWVKGFDETPIYARQIPELLTIERSFDFPIVGGELLFQELSHALEQLFNQLNIRYQLATCIRVTLDLYRAKSVALRIAFASPLNEAGRAFSLARERLSSLALQAPVAALLYHWRKIWPPVPLFASG